MCLTLEFAEQLCIWFIVLIAVISIIRLVVPALLSFFGLGGIVAQIIGIILWAIVAIIGIKILFMLLMCLFSAGGPHLRI